MTQFEKVKASLEKAIAVYNDCLNNNRSITKAEEKIDQLFGKATDLNILVMVSVHQKTRNLSICVFEQC